MHNSVRDEITNEVLSVVRRAIRKAVEGPQLTGHDIIIEKIEVFVNSPRGGGATVNVYADGRPKRERDPSRREKELTALKKAYGAQADRRSSGVKDRRGSKIKDFLRRSP